MAIDVDPVKWSKALRDVLKARAFWVYVFLASLIPLVLPSGATDVLGITKLREDLRPWLGAAALLSGIGLMVAQGHRVRAWWDAKEKARKLLQRLDTLSAEEKRLLKQYIDGNTKTQYFSIEDGVAMGLMALGVLYRPTQLGDLMSGFAFNIQPWAWDRLRQAPRLLEGAAQVEDKAGRRRI